MTGWEWNLNIIKSPVLKCCCRKALSYEPGTGLRVENYKSGISRRYNDIQKELPWRYEENSNSSDKEKHFVTVTFVLV